MHDGLFDGFLAYHWVLRLSSFPDLESCCCRRFGELLLCSFHSRLLKGLQPCRSRRHELRIRSVSEARHTRCEFVLAFSKLPDLKPAEVAVPAVFHRNHPE